MLNFGRGFLGRAATSNGSAIFVYSLYILVRRKKSENKKCKILDKRCFNVQRHQIVIECRLLDLKSTQKPLYFGTFSCRVGDIADLGDVSAR